MMKSPSCKPCVLTNSPVKFNIYFTYKSDYPTFEFIIFIYIYIYVNRQKTENRKVKKQIEGIYTSIFKHVHSAVVVRPKSA